MDPKDLYRDPWYRDYNPLLFDFLIDMSDDQVCRECIKQQNLIAKAQRTLKLHKDCLTVIENEMAVRGLIYNDKR